jgi:hypothetical protein
MDAGCKLASEHEKLWSQIEAKQVSETEIERTLDTIKTKTIDVSKAEAHQAISEKLRRRAYEEVLQSRGLSQHARNA